MPKPNIINSITVLDTVMYNETSCRISWAAASDCASYRLGASGDGGDFSVVYSGTAASFDYDVSAVDFGRIIFRVYGVNADGDSPFLESKAVTVIDYEIEDKPNGDMILQPFGLIIDSKSSRIDDVPAVRETSETIAGLDGEIPVDMKYSPRLFDLVTFMKGSFGSVADREEYIRKWSGHINRSVRKLRYLLYHGRIFGVKRISSAWTRQPSWCNLDISLKAYDILGYSPAESILYGDGVCVNGGDTECYPIIILRGSLNNPKITVNGVSYQIAIDTLDGDVVTIDCEKETVVRERNGIKTYVAGAYYLDFPMFKVGENTVSGCYAVKWRERWFAV